MVMSIENGGKGNSFELKLDEDGYYETQLWSLMEKFGDHCGLAKEYPFEIDIIIEN